MKAIGFTLLGIIAALWVIAMIAGMVAAFPYGLIGLLGFGGMGCLLIHVIAERMKNKEDDYYDKNIKQ